jgi:hypothetical protein
MRSSCQTRQQQSTRWIGWILVALVAWTEPTAAVRAGPEVGDDVAVVAEAA